MSTTALVVPVVVVGPSIDEATLTFVRTIMESEIQPHPSQELALNAFTTAFQRWNPKKICDIQPNNQPTLDLLFAANARKKSMPPFKKVTGNASNAVVASQQPYDEVFQDTIQRHRESIGNLVHIFRESLTNGTLTLIELKATCTTLESSTKTLWNSYKSYARRSAALEWPVLPTIVMIQSEMKKLQEKKETIQQYTTVCIQGKTYSLGDYTFQKVERDHCERFLRNTNIQIDVKEKLCTSALQQQLTLIQNTIGTNPDFLSWYAYFHHYCSVLLPPNMVKLPIIDTQTPFTFDVNIACSQIRAVFGPNLTYEGVGTALQLLSNENDYNQEMKLLMNCKILKLTALDIAHFRAIKLLHELATPLQDFLQCCNVHSFVSLHPSFRKLERYVKEFYSVPTHDRESCMKFLQQLYILMVSDTEKMNENKETSLLRRLLHRISRVHQAFPFRIRMLMKYIKDTSTEDLRSYFNEMDWLAMDENNMNAGLEIFQEDHEILLSFLSTHYPTDELQIMIAPLEAVVRLFFYIDRCCICDEVHEFLSGLKNDPDIETLLGETNSIQDDIHDMQGRLYTIQDLFQNIVVVCSHGDDDESTPPTPIAATSSTTTTSVQKKRKGVLNTKNIKKSKS